MATPTPQINLTGTFGIVYIGSIVSAVLYGVTCIQTFHYFRASSKDSNIIRALVLLLLVLDTFHQAVITELVYYYLVANYSNPLELTHNIWSIAAEVILDAVIATLVQSFLVARVWIVSEKNMVITVICGVLTCAHFATNITFPVKTTVISNLFTASTTWKTFGTAGLAVEAVTDVCISSSLCYYLHRGRTGLKGSDNIIMKLIALTITTGLFTMLIVIANLVALIAAPAKLYSLFFNFMLAKLYTNALLTSLNARAAIRNSQVGKSTLINTLSDSMPPMKFGQSLRGASAGNVVVDIETFTHVSISGSSGHMEMGKIGHSQEDSV